MFCEIEFRRSGKARKGGEAIVIRYGTGSGRVRR
jgi:hypothetical protein